MMEVNLSGFIIEKGSDILTALRKIDANKKGFLVVQDSSGNIDGVITDGDIRRHFISGRDMGDSINEVYTRDYKLIYEDDEISKVIELFKEESIKFLPIITRNKKLINIITKRQMHALLLQDSCIDIGFDFSAINESIVDYEIYQRPWGFYKTTVLNDYFQSKIISVKPGGVLSLQIHKHREEHWIIVHGKGIVRIDESEKKVSCGDSLFIPKGALHRITNIDEKESLIITEVQIGEYLGEDDIIRVEDLYGRI